MSWRGTLALVILAGLALGFFLFSSFTDSPTQGGPLLSLDPALADSIKIQESGSGFTLVKTNGQWNIRGTLNDRADPRLVHALLETAADITPLDLLKPRDLKGAVTLSSLDLKNPDRAVTIHAGKSHTLQLGVEGPAQGEIYSRLDGGKTVYLIAGDIATEAFHPIQEFRDPRLTALSPDHLDEATLTKGGDLQQLHLDKNPHGWNLKSPISAQGDTKAITSWLKTWLAARITSWMPEGTDPSACGMDSPSAVVTLREDGATNALTITVGAAVPDAPGSLYVRCSDRPGICMISGLAPSLAVTPLSLRSKKLKPVEYDTVDRIEIIGGASTRSLTRKPASDDWQMSQSGKSLDLPGNSVKEWFDQLQSLSATSFEPATPEHLTQRGLDSSLQPPAPASPSATNTPASPIRIRFIAQLSENTAQENAGEALLADYTFGSITNNEVALHEGEATDLMILPASALDLATHPPQSPDAHQ